MEYPVTLTPDDNDTYLVTFPDVDGAVTFGDTIEEALRRAPDALATILEAYIKDRRPIPPPSTRRTKYRVAVPALVEAKVRLYETMRAAKVTKAELGRRLDWHLPQIDRLLAMAHASQLSQLEAAFGVLGKRLVLGVVDVMSPAVSRRRKRTAPRSTVGARGRPRRASQHEKRSGSV
jgi:antitoxin HicB